MRTFAFRTAVPLVWPCLLLTAIACGDATGDGTTKEPEPASVIVTAGGDQEAMAGAVLPDSISITVFDQYGLPVPYVRVDWTAQDSGSVDPERSYTGKNGVASTTWKLGPAPGVHTVLANVRGYGPVTVHADAEPAPLVINTVHVMQITTYEGSGQTVHPDYTSVSQNSALRSDYLALTPYPFGNQAFENPSMYWSLDRVHWHVPAGGSNPVVEAPTDGGFLSDPDLVYNPVTQELWMYYRKVWEQNEIFLTKSSNGVAWSAPQRVASAINHGIVSPSIVRRSATEWLMWSVDGREGCEAPETWIDLRRSTDGETWSAPQRVSLTQPGFTPWHVDVQWIPDRNEYWAVYNVKTAESCATPALYLATSPDGITWKTYPAPVLARGEIEELGDIVYRATFRYRAESDAITFWYSGAQFNGIRYVWNSAAQRRQRADVFNAIALPPPPGLLARMSRQVPPLFDPP